MRQLSSLVAMALLSLNSQAAAPTAEKPTKSPESLDAKFVGTWKGECLTDEYEDEDVPAQDFFVVTPKAFTQHSFAFVGRKTCDTPSLMTLLEFKLEAGAKSPKGEQKVKTISSRIQIKALNVKAAIELSKRKECDFAHWQIGEFHECSNHEPYKSLMKGRPFEMVLRIVDGKFFYQTVDEDGISEEVEEFSPVKEIPWR